MSVTAAATMDYHSRIDPSPAARTFASTTASIQGRLRAVEADLHAELCDAWLAFPQSRTRVRELERVADELVERQLPALAWDLDEAYWALSELDPQLDADDRRCCLVHHRALVQPFFMQTPWGRRVVEKAFGYAGDYAVVEAIFDAERGRLGDTPMSRLLSRYLLNTGIVRAHRARLPWAHRRLAALAERRRRPLRLLSFACGPERILREWVAAGNAGQLVLCDFEPHALAYCRRRFAKLARRAAAGTTVDYVQLAAADVLSTPGGIAPLATAAPRGRYDAILVLGLLDYLPDVTIAPFLDSLAGLLDYGGELLLTNVHERNPWRALMKYDGDWYVRHRSRAAFEALAIGDPQRVASLEIETDPTGTNLFFAGEWRG